MAIDKGVWRPAYIDDWDWLEDCSPLAQRLWFWLTTGKQSTATGLQRVRQHAAVGVLRTKPAAFIAALAELEQAGKLLVQERGDGWVDLYLTLWVRRQCAVRDTQRQALKRLIERFADGAGKSQALEDWTVWDSACGQADSSLRSAKRQPEPQQEQDQEQKQEQKQDQIPPVVPQGGRLDLGEEQGEKVKKKKPAAIDDRAAQLVAEYARLCPSMPKAPPSALKAATAALKREPDLNVWLARFARAEASDFLSGRSKDWRANILWLLGPINVGKLDAGQYDNHRARNGPGPGMMRTPAGWMPEPERKYDEPDVLF